MLNRAIELYALNEKSITVVFGNDISAEQSKNILLFNTAINTNPFPGLVTTVPAYTTLTIFYDPFKVYRSALKGKSPFDKVANFIRQLEIDDQSAVQTGRKITIPVLYGGKFGPDLDWVAKSANLDTEEVIKMHSSAIYMVNMIGFVPGFAYLSGMDKQIAAPRKAQPRANVRAGSVGIAGEQTGIYALDTPGGWQIIGQTPFQLFNAKRLEPSLLKAGDEVTFKPISNAEFLSLKPQNED